MGDRKAVIKNPDMSDEMQQEPTELSDILETLESWTQYTDSFLKDIKASVAESDKNHVDRIATERKNEEVVTQNKENVRSSESNESNTDGPINAKRLRSRKRD